MRTISRILMSHKLLLLLQFDYLSNLSNKIFQLILNVKWQKIFNDTKTNFSLNLEFALGHLVSKMLRQNSWQI